jgi:hypothetical protein
MLMKFFVQGFFFSTSAKIALFMVRGVQDCTKDVQDFTLKTKKHLLEVFL